MPNAMGVLGMAIGLGENPAGIQVEFSLMERSGVEGMCVSRIGAALPTATFLLRVSISACTALQASHA